MHILAPAIKGNFTKVPNELLFSSLTPGQILVWLRLASIVFEGEEETHTTGGKLAESFGINENTLYWQLKDLEKAGGLVRKNGVLTLAIPEGTPGVDFDSISEEVAAKGRKRHSVTQKEANKIVAKVWNENKPAGWPEIGKTVHPTAFLAFEKQAKRLGVERQDYADMVNRVCAGLRKHEWWSKQSGLKIHSVFGWGVDLKDKDFLKVKSLYDLGVGGVKEAFDWTNDQHLLDWYASKEVEFDSVLRIVKDTKEDLLAWYDDESNHVDDPRICVVGSVAGAELPEIWPKMSQYKFLYFPTEA